METRGCTIISQRLIFTSYHEFRAWLDRLHQNKVMAELEGTKEFINRLFQRSQELCPVLTGLLKSTGRIVQTGPLTWMITYGDPGVGCDYARHVYYGHFAGETWVPGRPWIEWAMWDLQGEWSQETINRLRRIH